MVVTEHLSGESQNTLACPLNLMGCTSTCWNQVDARPAHIVLHH